MGPSNSITPKSITPMSWITTLIPPNRKIRRAREAGRNLFFLCVFLAMRNKDQWIIQIDTKPNINRIDGHMTPPEIKSREMKSKGE